ncbi:hypothetical protein [Aliamphritea spongicola]|nr:hypothetical protein [Aliamphritea spongicola]
MTDHLFEADNNRMTCSAGTAPIDMMLLLMHEHWGRRLLTGYPGICFISNCAAVANPRRHWCGNMAMTFPNSCSTPFT